MAKALKSKYTIARYEPFMVSNGIQVCNDIQDTLELIYQVLNILLLTGG